MANKNRQGKEKKKKSQKAKMKQVYRGYAGNRLPIVRNEGGNAV